MMDDDEEYDHFLNTSDEVLRRIQNSEEIPDELIDALHRPKNSTAVSDFILNTSLDAIIRYRYQTSSPPSIVRRPPPISLDNQLSIEDSPVQPIVVNCNHPCAHSPTKCDFIYLFAFFCILIFIVVFLYSSVHSKSEVY